MNEINEKYSEILACKEYLNATDYMILKQSETGLKAPQDVLLKRSEMRGMINAIESEIKELELTEQDIEELNPIIDPKTQPDEEAN